MKRIELKRGQKFGRLSVLCSASPGPNGVTRWRCRCSCGGRKIVITSNLVHGRTQSCGCLHHEMMIKRNYRHGKIHTPEYRCWKHINNRCYNESDPAYPDYGGRGIKVCSRWRRGNPVGFTNFRADMGQRPPGRSIDRINNDGNYNPSNCVWSTSVQQHRNRRNSRLVTYRGKQYTLRELADLFNLSHASVAQRYVEGDRMPLLVRPRGDRKS